MPDQTQPKCCICKKNKATGIPYTTHTLRNGEVKYDFLYIGSCTDADCIRIRFKEVA